MRRIALLVVAALVAFVGEARAQGSDQGTACVLNTQLSPENEVRTPANTNDPTVESTATGHAQVKVRNDGTLEIKVFILNQDAETFTAGHIHEGPAGVNGPIVVPLFDGSTSDEHFVQHQTVAVPETFDVFELCEEPGEYYVNYHTTQDPVGATRGQLD
jgi:Cu/Zn superoxide dismutase